MLLLCYTVLIVILHTKMFDFYILMKTRGCFSPRDSFPISPAFCNPLRLQLLWFAAIWPCAFDFVNKVPNCFCSCYQCSLPCCKWRKQKEKKKISTTYTTFYSCGSLPRPRLWLSSVHSSTQMLTLLHPWFKEDIKVNPFQ